MIRPLAIAGLAAGLLALASPAAALSVRPCDGTTDQAMNLVEPWSGHSWSFYQGRVRVAVLDTGGEPACCSSHLLVMFADEDEPGGGMVCRIVSDSGERGFAGIDPKSVKSAYDPRRGLLVSFGYSYFPPDGDGSRTTPGAGQVRVNLARKTVTAE
jgi:hypothetical protein